MADQFSPEVARLYTAIVDVRTCRNMLRDYGPTSDNPERPVRNLCVGFERAWQRYYAAKAALGDAIDSPECRRIVEEGLGHPI